MDTPSLSLIVLGMLEERVDGILKAMVNFSPLVEVWSIITLYTLADVEHYELARYWAATEVECCSMVFGFRILILCSTYSNILYFNSTRVYYMYLYLCIYTLETRILEKRTQWSKAVRYEARDYRRQCFISHHTSGSNHPNPVEPYSRRFHNSKCSEAVSSTHNHTIWVSTSDRVTSKRNTHDKEREIMI